MQASKPILWIRHWHMTQFIPVRLGRCYLGGISRWKITWLQWGSWKKPQWWRFLCRWPRSMLGNKDCKKVWQAGLGGLHKVLSQLKGHPGTEMALQWTSWIEVSEWGIFLLHVVIGVTCPWEAGTTYSVTLFKEILKCEPSAAGPLAVGGYSASVLKGFIGTTLQSTSLPLHSLGPPDLCRKVILSGSSCSSWRKNNNNNNSGWYHTSSL